MKQNEAYINGEKVVYDLSPLIDLMALDTNDQEYFRELTSRNKLYWKYQNERNEAK